MGWSCLTYWETWLKANSFHTMCLLGLLASLISFCLLTIKSYTFSTVHYFANFFCCSFSYWAKLLTKTLLWLYSTVLLTFHPPFFGQRAERIGVGVWGGRVLLGLNHVVADFSGGWKIGAEKSGLKWRVLKCPGNLMYNNSKWIFWDFLPIPSPDFADGK